MPNKLIATRQIISPQDGFQKNFLRSSADITIGGAMAGVGKSYALLMSILPYINIKGFAAVAFRRTTPMITNEGGLLSESLNLYGLAGGKLKQNPIRWSFNDGNAHISFTHLQHDKNAEDHKGAQYAAILFDEITHFTKNQFLGLVGRARTTCGIDPFIKATCNPDPDSFIYDYVKWYLDSEGYPDHDKVGKIRYMYTKSNSIIWGDTPQEVYDQEPQEILSVARSSGTKPEQLITSFTFITGRLADNKKLMESDPQYIAKLASLPENEKLRLMYGCWKQGEDTDALINFDKIRSIYEYTEPSDTSRRYITVDVARYGRDWAVIFVWKGYHVVRTEILTKCSLDHLSDRIVSCQAKYNIAATNVIVDEGGVGGGIIDFGAGYIGFVANAQPIGQEQYVNLKTQLHYVFANEVNDDKIKIDTDSIYIDGVNNCFVNMNGNIKEVRSLITEQLKSIKRKQGTTPHDKKALISKEEQRALISTSSPDLSDALVLRAYFALKSNKVYYDNFRANDVVTYALQINREFPIHLIYHSASGNKAVCIATQIVQLPTTILVNVIDVMMSDTFADVVDISIDKYIPLKTQVRYHLRPSRFISGLLGESTYRNDVNLLRDKMNAVKIGIINDKCISKNTDDVKMHQFCQKILAANSGIVFKVDGNNCTELILELNSLRVNESVDIKERVGTIGMVTDAFFGFCRTMFKNKI